MKHRFLLDCISEFKLLEQQYWTYKKSLKLSDDLKPNNLTTERTQFFNALKRGEPYNPQFNYSERSEEETLKTINTLQKLKTQFKEANFAILTDAYCELIDSDIHWVELMQKRSSPSFGFEFAQMYLPIDPCVLEWAEQIISEFDITEVISKPDSNINATEAKRRFEQELRDRKYTNWKVELLDQPARVSVNSIERKLKLRSNALFSEDDIRRLIVHEIDVHIARSENGRRQPFLIFAYGFSDYLETEEGLATYNEEAYGLSSKRKIYNYATRALLCNKVEHLTFYDLYEEALRLYPHEQELAYDIAVRIKRGLIDTSLRGGYTKDRLYLSGYLKVKELSETEREILKIGKIGIGDISRTQYLLEQEAD